MNDTYPFVYWAVGGGLVLLGLLTTLYIWNFSHQHPKKL